MVVCNYKGKQLDTSSKASIVKNSHDGGELLITSNCYSKPDED